MRRSLTVAALAAAMFIVAPLPARAATVEPDSFHGYTADAVFNSSSGDVQTDADITLLIGKATNSDGVAVPVSVLVVELWVGDDFHAAGATSLEPQDYTFDTAKLTSASVHKTLTLSTEAGVQLTVIVDVEWMAWGRYDSGKNGGFVVPGEYILNVTTKNREFISATGSIVAGSTNYTPVPTSGGYVQQVNYNSKTFTH